ncbi:MAG: SIS domain-containing protein [Bacillota bacterium]|nr:SIS domain-containing protein [Bacillota bacterium]
MARFLAEVTEEPRVMRSLVQQYRGPMEAQLKQAAAEIVHHPVTLFTGMGSSLYASLASQYLLRACGRMAFSEEAGELLHYGSRMLSDKVGVVMISQSGSSAETCSLMRLRKEILGKAGDHGIVIVTNDQGSEMGREGANVLPLMAGEEGGTSSKTFAASLVVLTLLAEEVSGRRTPQQEFLLCFDEIENCLSYWCREALAAVDLLRGRPNVSVIGRGSSLAAVNQAALILSEMAKVQAMPFAGGSFRHGPLEFAGESHSAVIVAPGDETQPLLLKLAAELASYGSRVWVLSDKPVVDVGGGGDNIRLTRLPHANSHLSPMVASIPLQLFAAYYAAALGYDPGVLQRCSKVTSIQ